MVMNESIKFSGVIMMNVLRRVYCENLLTMFAVYLRCRVMVILNSLIRRCRSLCMGIQVVCPFFSNVSDI